MNKKRPFYLDKQAERKEWKFFLFFSGIIIFLLVWGYWIGWRNGVTKSLIEGPPCPCLKTDPVAAFIQSQPNIAIDMTGVPADKVPKRWILRKGWDKVKSKGGPLVSKNKNMDSTGK